MPRRVDARDVLDANATTRRAFSGRVVAAFRRSGPNAWDDYVRVDEDGGAIEVHAGIPIQVEKKGALFRMRRRGTVIVVTWVPEEGMAGEGADLRAEFLRSCVLDEDPTPDGNLALWLHGELSREPEPKD